MRLKFQAQHDESDCGAACLRMILNYYGKNISLSQLRIAAGTDKAGTSGYGIINCANQFGLSCKGFTVPDKALISTIPFPAIFHIFENGLEHYVVVNGIKRNQITIYDPAKGIKKTSLSTFLEQWSGIIFICKPVESINTDFSSESLLGNYLNLLKNHKPLIFKILGSSLFLSFLGILLAFYFRFLIDEVLYSEAKSTLNIISICYLIILIFQTTLNYIRNQLTLVMGIKIDVTLICEFFNHLLKLPLDFFTSRKTGEILSRARDTENIRRLLSSTTVSVFIDSVMIILGAFFLFKLGNGLIIPAVIPVIVSSIIVCCFSRILKKLIRERAIGEGNKWANVFETVNGIATIKALSTEADAFRRNELLSVESGKRTYKVETFGNFNQLIQNFIYGIGTLLLYWIGSYKIFDGEMSLGQLISFVTLSSFFLAPLSRLLTLYPTLQEAIISAERLNDIFCLKTEDYNETNTQPIGSFLNEIKITNLNFAYGTRGHALYNINLSIQKGEKIAIVGTSGSGKSTFIKLLMKFYKPNSGSIFIDENNISFITTKDYRKLFGYVPQETLLFSGTILENLTWGLENYTPQMLHEAVKAANLLDFINNLPLGFNTLIGEQGTTLSGGERQRIALARVLLRNPQIIVLDEATASLDAICEKSIMETVNHMIDKTIIIIAHKLSTITHCDKIVVMENGKIVETGTHTELLKKKTLYKKLWEAQFEN